MGNARSAGEVGGVLLIGVTQFCDALHRATLHGPRDDQGAQGEALWELYEALEEKFPIGSGAIVELPLRTVDEIMETIQGLLIRGEIPRHDHVEGLAVLLHNLTASGVPKEIAE